jgi:hypothetical protein
MEVQSILEGSSGNERGGLIVMKKGKEKSAATSLDDEKLFKKPSMLGLDRLAKAKREDNLRKRQAETGNETPGLTDSVRQEIKR